MSFVLGANDAAPGLRLAIEPASWCDVHVRAAAQTIERRVLVEDDPSLAEARAAILGAIPAFEFESGWVYDWAAVEPEGCGARDAERG